MTAGRGSEGAQLPIVPVFVIHYAAPDWCRSAVRSISASEHVDVRIVVIDNGGAALPDLGETVRVVRTDANLGYTGGANMALQLFATEYGDADALVVASHDLHVDRDCLAVLHDALMGDDHVGIAGPVLESSPRSTGGSWRPHARRQSYEPWIATSTQPVRRDWLSGTCLMIRRRCAADVGDLDAGFGSYLEDVDYCLRARDEGWDVVVVPGARASGLGSATTSSHQSIARNRLRLIEKREGRRAARRGKVEYLQAIPGLIARGAWASLRGAPGGQWQEARALTGALLHKAPAEEQR